MIARWQTALAFALTGVELDLPAGEQPDPEALVDQLTEQGWTASRLADHARQVVEDEQPWPHPLPPALRDGCGPAQLHAALNRARELLEVQTLQTRPPSVRRRLNPDEQRLMREVPPHHGH